MTLQDSHYRYRLVREVLRQLAASAPTESGQPGTCIRKARLACYDTATNGYIIALLDMLAYLGLVSVDDENATLQVVSVQAGHFLQMMMALGDVRKPLVADWHSEGVTSAMEHPFEKGVDLLAAAERLRLDMMPESYPLRETVAVLGLIARRTKSGERQYLLVWDEPAQRWQLVGGQASVQDTSLQAALLRELAEELACEPLSAGVHVQVAAIGTPFHLQRFSPTYGMLTRTVFHVFAVQFLIPLPLPPTGTRWVSEAELCAQRTGDGQPIAAEPFHALVEQEGVDLDKIYEPVSRNLP
jgi:8-oxo-dGTP pyrophosphatase MutT (NUDIX family)